jgi:hypothetical protein
MKILLINETSIIPAGAVRVTCSYNSVRYAPLLLYLYKGSYQLLYRYRYVFRHVVLPPVPGTLVLYVVLFF